MRKLYKYLLIQTCNNYFQNLQGDTHWICRVYSSQRHGSTLGHIFWKRGFCLLASPKQMSFLTIYSENILLKTQGTRFDVILTPHKGLEQAPSYVDDVLILYQELQSKVTNHSFSGEKYWTYHNLWLVIYSTESVIYSWVNFCTTNETHEQVFSFYEEDKINDEIKQSLKKFSLFSLLNTPYIPIPILVIHIFLFLSNQFTNNWTKISKISKEL